MTGGRGAQRHGQGAGGFWFPQEYGAVDPVMAEKVQGLEERETGKQSREVPRGDLSAHEWKDAVCIC